MTMPKAAGKILLKKLNMKMFPLIKMLLKKWMKQNQKSVKHIMGNK